MAIVLRPPPPKKKDSVNSVNLKLNNTSHEHGYFSSAKEPDPLKS